MLKIETEYKSKTGEMVQLRTPKMQVMGKLMGDTEKPEVQERHEFLILCDGIKVDLPNTQFNKSQYAKYKLFVKYPDQDQAFNLELSQQAYGAINALSPQKWDRPIISKGLKANPKTGAINPIVVAELVKGDNHKDTPAPNPQQELPHDRVNNQFENIESQPNEVEKEFLEGYIKATQKEQRTTTHFIGAYVRNKMEKEYFVMRLEFLYTQWIKNTTL